MTSSSGTFGKPLTGRMLLAGGHAFRFPPLGAMHCHSPPRKSTAFVAKLAPFLTSHSQITRTSHFAQLRLMFSVSNGVPLQFRQPVSTWAAGSSCNRGPDAGNSRARRLPSSTLEIPNPVFRADPVCASGTGNPSSAAASARSFRASCPWTRNMFSLLRFGKMVSAIALSL